MALESIHPTGRRQTEHLTSDGHEPNLAAPHPALQPFRQRTAFFRFKHQQPVAFDNALPIVPVQDQSMRGRQFANRLKNREGGWNILKSQILVQGRHILWRHRYSEHAQGLDFGGEGEAGGRTGIIQRFDAQMIASQECAPPRPIHNAKGEHPTEPFHTRGPHSSYACTITSVSHRVRNRWPRIPISAANPCDCNLAIERNPDGFILIGHGWAPPHTSMIANRRCPRPAEPRQYRPAPSGPDAPAWRSWLQFAVFDRRRVQSDKPVIHTWNSPFQKSL